MKVHYNVAPVLLLLLDLQLSGCAAEAEKGDSGMKTISKRTEEKGFTNRLINESSPYLLQHAHNPVDWYPWSGEALEKAEREDKPIFLSIGYAACHWCHVMEKESFENAEIAEILNEHFVSIKVDREQRPDLDQIYMAATMAMTGSGGWPMSVFLTPDLKPFYAGTYFPPEDGYGRPGFRSLITQIAEAYKTQRSKIDEYSNAFVDNLLSAYGAQNDGARPDRSVVDKAARGLLYSYDAVNGGFGGAPKFPHATDLSFMLKVNASTGKQELLEAVEHTLQAMARGGIYDQLGGGFHRYATDGRWLVPHFEKMLYDNAMLAVTYSEAYQITKNEFDRRIVRETLDFIIREMGHENGGFYSSLDADSEGEEGKFYVWTRAEIDRLLGKKSDIFCRYYNISAQGNFEHGTNIPNLDSSSDRFRERYESGEKEFDRLIEESKRILFAERSKRARPFTDDKILTSWNGLAISGLAKGYQSTGDTRYREAALKTAVFIRDSLLTDGRLIHSYREGKVSEGLFLEDYAYLIHGLIDLYEIVHDYEWIKLASRLASDAAEMFSDDIGNLYLSPADQTDHFMRPRDISDGALPAPGSILIQSLLKLADIAGEKQLRRDGEKFIASISGNVSDMPHGTISAVVALDYLLSDKIEVVIVGENGRSDFLRVIYDRYLPHRVVVVSRKGDEPISLLEGRRSNGRTLAYVCKNSTCRIPASTPGQLKMQLAEL
ncbi:MAG: thioredoxin domain-containing protein [Candidatus Zixiibacteriota bacterium]|nr:MAG: thioredoxin domain-containing protein [candidate division Zixibacteria bacterium]